MNRIITLGREFGSGGRELGRRLSEKLGIAYYDQEIITEIAKRTALSVEYIHRIEDSVPVASFPIHIGRTFFSMPNPVFQQSINLFREQHKLISELAEKSDCLIVGRCADYILAGRENTINVFIHAPREARVKRIMELNQIGEAEALKMLTNSDKERGNHYFRYTDQKWGKAQNYDVCINSSLMGVEKTAEMLADMARIEVRN